MLVAAAVLVLGAAIPLIRLVEPLIVVVPVWVLLLNPILFPLIVPDPAAPGENRIPL